MEFARQLHAIAAEINHGDGRPVVAENIHLTLVFLGAVTASFRQCAERVTCAVRAEPFTLIIQRLGCWPKSGILWSGTESTPQALLNLVQNLNSGLACCGYAPDNRAYAAHLTLARKVHQWQKDYPIEPLSWDVRRFCLAASPVDVQAARYKILCTWELAPAAG